MGFARGLFNPYRSEDASNQIGFRLMKQVKPRLIIPTHLWEDAPTVTLLAATWPSSYTSKPCIDLTTGTRPDATSVLFMGYNADDWSEQMKLPPSTW